MHRRGALPPQPHGCLALLVLVPLARVVLVASFALVAILALGAIAKLAMLETPAAQLAPSTTGTTALPSRSMKIYLRRIQILSSKQSEAKIRKNCNGYNLSVSQRKVDPIITNDSGTTASVLKESGHSI